MKFEIIKNSEGCKKWNIPDNEYRGQIPGLCCGWEFEVKNDKGDLNSLSVIYDECTPEECAEYHHFYEPYETFRMNGWELTGRVVFRGYGKLYWYAEERDWCVNTLTDEEVDQMLSA